MKKKTNFLFLAFLLGFVFISTIKVDQAVDIADDILELAIRQNLNYYGKPIYKSQLLNIYDLDISGKGINQLDGIEHFRNLEVLDLSQNSVRDMTPVESLTNLKIINLKRNEICDLENVNFHAISGLELIELNLGYNNLDNVSLLGDMDSLNRLDLAGNRINDLEPISSLILLNELDLTGNNIDTISGLTLYASLEKLVLRDNNLEKIVELGYFENLKYLNLRENHIKDLSPVGNLQTLQYLNIHSNTMIESIAPLKNLVQLKQLIMRNVPIGEQISYINGLNNLYRLNLRNTKTEDFSVLINLMESGVLQDREDVGLFAEVNLLDNDLGLDYLYQYHNMRPYWSNISYRWPFSLPIYHRLIESPGFSHESGYYTDDFLLTFSSANPDHEIIYTIDGSEPIIDRKGRPLGTTRIYYGPIEILNQKTQPNILSEIKSSPLNAGDYSPPNEIFKAPIIRAQSIDKNGNASNIVSHTYFVDEIMMNRYTLPVVSLITDPEGFFGDKAGIYVPGEIIQAYDNIHCCSANYRQRGIKWERLVVLQLFNPDGEVELSQNIGVRIHGGASRDYPKKSLRIYSGYYYDPKGLINYNFFPMLDDRLSDQSVNTFDSLILRTGGNDDEQLSMIRDIIAHRLLENTLLDIQGNYPVVYLCGKVVL